MRKSPIKSKPTPARTPAARTVPPRIPAWLPAILLALLTIAVYWLATRCGFVNYDDPDYVTENPYVQAGLNWKSVKWAFCNPVSFNWHPLTVMSHMLDCQLFGLNPWGHHLVSVLFHSLNAALVFALLRQLTGATWRSLLVAALFAFHPLRVESVAWVSERKDVLSGFFGLLVLIFYTRYARKSEVRSQKSETNLPTVSSFLRSPFYWLSLLFFVLGLMSKPMLVTWPFVMLLLDYWPLQRVTGDKWQVAGILRLVLEKIPFFALAAAASVVTFVVQKQEGAVIANEYLPFSARIENVLVSYCRYLGKMIWPTDLAVFYPRPGYWPLAKVLLAGGLLAGLSVLFWMQRRRYPFLLMGWLWFIGTLVPVIGLVQVGGQAMADRYTYIPSLGVFILVVWGAHEFTRGWRFHVMVLSLAGSLAIILCMALTRQQLWYWQDSETLFRHALAVTENNYVAHDGLGTALNNRGQTDEAISQFQEAIRLKPYDADSHNNLGVALAQKGQLDEAITQYQEVIRLKPYDADSHNNLGAALAQKGQLDEAITQYQEVIRLKPYDADSHNNLGAALAQKGQLDEAITQYQEAIRLKPDFAGAYDNLGTTLDQKGQLDEAISQYQEAIRLKLDSAEIHYNLGTDLIKKGRLDEAISQLQDAIRLKPDYVEAHNNLATALGMKGRLDEAIAQYQEAIRLKPDYTEARNNLARVLEIKNAPAGR